MNTKFGTVLVGVTIYDIRRAEKDPSRCPATRAIARALGENVYDVDVSNDYVYIWDEWDNPRQVYMFEDEQVKKDIFSWESNLEEIENVSILPFEFNLIKRK